MLSAAELRHYETFGFVVKRGLLSAEEIDTIRAEHAAALASAQGHRAATEPPQRLWTRFQPLPEDVAPFTTLLIEDERFLAPATQAMGSAIGLGTDANRYVGDTGWCELSLSLSVCVCVCVRVCVCLCTTYALASVRVRAAA